MDDLRKQKSLRTGILVAGGAVLLLLASITILSAALQNWPFTTASNYTFDSRKIEINDGQAILKLYPPAVVHDKQSDFTGTHSDTQWLTDHIELNSAGLSTGFGTYTSQPMDSGAAGTVWGRLSWTEELNQGEAQFSATKQIGTLAVGRSVFGADIDGGDDIDVIAVQDSQPAVLYFQNNGAQGFSQRTISYGGPRGAQDLHVADINQDGRRDVVVLASGVLEWFENGGGVVPTWQRGIIARPSAGTEVEVADVNGDGALDVLIGDGTTVKWYQNSGTNRPSWIAWTLDNTLSSVDALSTGDLDSDGDLDLLAGDQSGLYWYENNGANPPLFTKRIIDLSLSNVESVVAADINNDGRLDVVGVGGNTKVLNWYENEGIASPVFIKRTIDSGPLSLPVSVGVGDLDRDGDLDLVLGTNTEVYAYRNDGGSPHSWSKATLAAGTVSSGDHVFVVNLEDDLDGDDDLDILVAEASTIPWWENLLPHSDIRFQLSTSEDGITWFAWQGPGGRTTSSYTKSAGETVTVNSGRYIQYRVYMRTHNSTSLNARLAMVRLEPASVTYPNDAPTIQNVTGTSFTEITAFNETLGSGNQGLVRYQISNDGASWFYHNGSRWMTATNGIGQSNTADEVNARIATFDNDVGTGTFHFKAFLISDGAQQVVLDQITIDYSTDTQVASGGSGAEQPGGSGGSGSGTPSPSTPQTPPVPQDSEVTPKIIANKSDFKFRQDADFDFEYTTKERLQARGSWKQEYELYEQDIDQRRQQLKARRAQKNFRKAQKKLVKAGETVETFVYDAYGNLTDIEGQIEELREGRFSVTLPKKRARRPGKYKLEVKLVKDGVTYIENQEFTWGVLAINVDKSYYLANEISTIGIGVLDDQGHMVCDADVTLEIIDPLARTTTLSTANQTIQVSPECENYGVTDLPDYYTNYTTSVFGKYDLNLTAVTPNGTRSIQDSFEVVTAVDFDVTRSGPTRIYPPRALSDEIYRQSEPGL